MHAVLLFFTLFICWIIFSGFLDLFFLSLGAISCAIAVWYAYKMRVFDKDSFPLYLRSGAPFYLLWLFKEILMSSFAVAHNIWRVKPKISPAFAWVTTTQKSDVAIATYASSITLTPGTLCIDTEGNKLQVHALTEENLAELRAGDMDRKVSLCIGE